VVAGERGELQPPIRHLVAIHEGYMRVTGKARDGLVWEIGL